MSSCQTFKCPLTFCYRSGSPVEECTGWAEHLEWVPAEMSSQAESDTRPDTYAHVNLGTGFLGSLCLHPSRQKCSLKCNPNIGFTKRWLAC